MARRIAISNLNASTLDILNTIRANASAEYQQYVPEVTKATDIPKVGEVLYGYPAFANQFINALVNRIALVRVKSATFNNDYAELKKGYLEFGETVEEVFVSIAKAREFSAEKAKDREFKRTLPDVRSAFHTMNFRVQYPVTIQDEDLRMAFMSINGVQDLIAKIVNSVYVAEQYDEFLLFKYLLIKAVAHGKTFTFNAGKGSDYNSWAASFRAASNRLTFMSNAFNAEGVTTVTPKDDQYIFMDSDFNAKFDVNVLASAFNMDKANFMGRLKLIDDFTTFDNERFSEIIDGSDMIEPITPEELNKMSGVHAIIVDREWFQIYDNNNKFTEDYVAAGMYWNYFYNVWKTVSWSPFSNIITFIDSVYSPEYPQTITTQIENIEDYDGGKIITLSTDDDNATLASTILKYEQTEALTKAGIAVHPYGAYIIPNGSLTGDSLNIVTTLKRGMASYNYTGSISTAQLETVGTQIILTKQQ